MAKKYNQIKDKKLKDLLSQQQINKVDAIEAYIDTKIENEFPSVQITIDYCVMRFECDPITHAPLSYPEPKRQIMQDLLFERFNDAGWKIELLYPEKKILNAPIPEPLPKMWKLFL